MNITTKYDMGQTLVWATTFGTVTGKVCSIKLNGEGIAYNLEYEDSYGLETTGYISELSEELMNEAEYAAMIRKDEELFQWLRAPR